jgi:hypothetical protein
VDSPPGLHSALHVLTHALALLARQLAVSEIASLEGLVAKLEGKLADSEKRLGELRGQGGSMSQVPTPTTLRSSRPHPSYP